MKPRTVGGYLLTAVTLALVACGDDDSPGPGPDPDDGVSSVLLSRPMGAIEFQRSALRGWLQGWEEDDTASPPDVSWRWSESTRMWTHDVESWSTVSVGVAGGGSTEVRTRYRNRLDVTLTRDGSRVREFREADRMTIAMQDSVRHYVLDPEVYAIDDPYTFTTAGSYAMDVVDGKLRPVAGNGTVSGWVRSDAEGSWAVYRIEGTFGVTFGFAAGFDPCASEGLTADVAVLDDAGVELDRFTGSFSVEQGGPTFSGFMVSERGPWRYGINGGRSCP